ncbi:MAG TPA: carboxypeptidase-like regulatory domain-containing protein [Candidatus Eisenbacteria bacterium]|nr:carboxypeptidase-like regulatory domain-containing protein [Candidatus Eisenbacteria bacterium]
MPRLRLAFIPVLVLLALLLAPGQVRSATDSLGVISGKVVSADDGLAIQNATPLVLNQRLGAVTNRAGEFRIDRIPTGTQTLRVMIVGFKKVDRKVTILPGENLIGTIALEPQPLKLIDGDGLVRRNPPGGSVGSSVADANLQCAVRLVDPEPTVGDALEVEARIYNLSKSEIALPVGRDGCDGLQLPWITVRIDGPTDGFVVKPEGRPNGKPLRRKDLVTVKPGDSFDPLLRGWKPTNLALGRIKKPGKYRLVFEYSTYESNSDRWLGDTRFAKSAQTLVERLWSVPLVQLADSVSFVVRE